MATPVSSYIVCATPRSGSTLLCEALRSTGIAGVPREYFSHWRRAEKAHLEPLSREALRHWRVPPEEYLDKVRLRGTTPNGVLGIKIMWSHFDTAMRNLRNLAPLSGLRPHDVLARVFPSPRYVFITRADKVRQAVSITKARQAGTGGWVSLDPALLDDPALWKSDFPDLTLEDLTRLRDQLRAAMAASASRPLVYAFDQIAASHAMIIEQEAAWRDFFETAGIRPYTVAYEDLIAAYDDTLRGVLEFLELEVGVEPVAPPVLRQGDAVNDAWAARYAAELETS